VVLYYNNYHPTINILRAVGLLLDACSRLEQSISTIFHCGGSSPGGCVLERFPIWWACFVDGLQLSVRFRSDDFNSLTCTHAGTAPTATFGLLPTQGKTLGINYSHKSNSQISSRNHAEIAHRKLFGNGCSSYEPPRWHMAVNDWTNLTRLNCYTPTVASLLGDQPTGLSSDSPHLLFLTPLLSSRLIASRPPLQPCTPPTTLSVPTVLSPSHPYYSPQPLPFLPPLCQSFVVVLRITCSFIHIQALFNNCTFFLSCLRSFYTFLLHLVTLSHQNLLL